MKYKDEIEQSAALCEEPLSEHEICVHCLSLGKDVRASIHLHQDIVRGQIDSELVCRPCYELQKQPEYSPPKLSQQQKEKIAKRVSEFHKQRQGSIDDLEHFL